MDERRILVEKAKLAEQAARTDDMIETMNAVVKQGRELSVEERNLLANAYTNHVGAKRAAWRTLSSIEQKTVEGTSRRKELSREYRNKVEEELKATCSELLTLLDTHLINTKDVENEIFYLKMKGDYYRYLAEICHNTHSDQVFDNAKVAYARAYELARENLSPGHPLLLGLVMNFSVFYYEQLECYEIALEIARDSVADGEDDLRNQPEPTRSDSELILQLIKDNLRLWTVEREKHTNLKFV